MGNSCCDGTRKNMDDHLLDMEAKNKQNIARKISEDVEECYEDFENYEQPRLHKKQDYKSYDPTADSISWSKTEILDMNSLSVSVDNLSVSATAKDIDFNIFDLRSPNKEECNGYQNCDALKRASNGMKYYQSLFARGNRNIAQEEFMSFIQDNYDTFLDDYNHIIKQHAHDIQLIANELIDNHGFTQCEVGKCNTLQRHYSRNINDNMNVNEDCDAEYTFYASCFDQLHHFIFHLYSLGLRADSTNNITFQMIEN
eukprot:443293_1